MFFSFFLPFEVEHSQHEFVLYKMMDEFSTDDLFVIGPSFYFKRESEIPPNKYCKDVSAQYLRGFKLPDNKKLSKLNKEVIPDSLVEELLSCYSNVDEAFSRIQDTKNDLLISWLTVFFENKINLGIKIDAIIVWRDCESLKFVARLLGLRIIHNEYSVYRKPEYDDKMIFDFGGFKSSSEVFVRYENACFNDNYPWDKIMRLVERYYPNLIRRDKSNLNQSVGVLLGVEWENAYVGGLDNYSLINSAKKYNKNIIVRPHPIDRNKNIGNYEYDYTNTLSYIISSSSRIITLLSGAGVEAIANGVETEFMCDVPLRFLEFHGLSDIEIKKRWGFFIYSYLIPGCLTFDKTYYSWRLSVVDEAEIVTAHLQVYNLL